MGWGGYKVNRHLPHIKAVSLDFRVGVTGNRLLLMAYNDGVILVFNRRESTENPGMLVPFFVF